MVVGHHFGQVATAFPHGPRRQQTELGLIRASALAFSTAKGAGHRGGRDGQQRRVQQPRDGAVDAERDTHLQHVQAGSRKSLLR